MESLEKFEPLFTLVRKSDACISDVEKLVPHLPEDNEELVELLIRLARDRRHHEYLMIFLTAVFDERRPHISVFSEGITLMTELGLLPILASRCSGDVAGELLKLAKIKYLTEQVSYILLIVVLWWFKKKEPHRSKEEVLEVAKNITESMETETDFLPCGAFLIYIDESEMPFLNHIQQNGRRINTGLLQKQCKAYLDGLIKQIELPPDKWLVKTREQLKERPSTLPRKRAVQKIGRNEKCPCGSNKKYKQCCIRKDQSRLRESSHVFGKTRQELTYSFQNTLTLEAVMHTLPSQLAQLDFKALDPPLQKAVITRMTDRVELEGAARFWEIMGISEDLEPMFSYGLKQAVWIDQPKMLKRLAGLIEQDRMEGLPDCLIPKILLQEGAPHPNLFTLEKEFNRELDNPTELASLAISLMNWELPSLGIALARGVLAGEVDGFHARDLLNQILMARSQLDLHPSDFSEDRARRLIREAEQEPDMIEEFEVQQKKIGQQDARIRKLHEEIWQLSNKVRRQEGYRQKEETLQKQSERSRESASYPELKNLREKYSTLKSDLKALHKDRNQAHKELVVAQEELSNRDPDSQTLSPDRKSDNERETELLLEEISSIQPLRIPIFPKRFLLSLKSIPKIVKTEMMRIVGAMAGGDSSAFKGTRKLKLKPNYCRQRVKRNYRVILRIDEEFIHVIDLIPRCDLERRIGSL